MSHDADLLCWPWHAPRVALLLGDVLVIGRRASVTYEDTLALALSCESVRPNTLVTTLRCTSHWTGTRLHVAAGRYVEPTAADAQLLPRSDGFTLTDNGRTLALSLRRVPSDKLAWQLSKRFASSASEQALLLLQANQEPSGLVPIVELSCGWRYFSPSLKDFDDFTVNQKRCQLGRHARTPGASVMLGPRVIEGGTPLDRRASDGHLVLSIVADGVPDLPHSR